MLQVPSCLPLVLFVHGVLLSMAMAQPSAYHVVSPAVLQPGKPLPHPQQEVVLTVRGRLGNSQADDTVTFDVPTLEQIGLIRFTTPTSWTDKPVTFEGILMSHLLALLAVPPEAMAAKMTALNDYQITIPLAEFRQWPVMIALKRDGQYMPVRDKGPLWLVYPRHAFPELAKIEHNAKWIWQLKDIVIR